MFIPETAKEKPLAGKVVAVGPGTSEVTMEVKAGDEVLYGKYAGTEGHVDGKDYIIMRQSDIPALIEIRICKIIKPNNHGKGNQIRRGSA